MMKLQKLLLATVMTVLISALPAAAENNQYLAGYHSDYGATLYQEGKVPLAIEEFIEALLLDSSNDKAKEHLKRLVAEQEASLQNNRGILLRFVELIDYIDFLKSRIDYLKESSETLINFTLSHGKYNQSLVKEVESIRETMQQRLRWPGPEIKNIHPDKNLHIMNLEKYLAGLKIDKEELVEQLSEIQIFNDQLRKIKRDVTVHLSRVRKKEQTSMTNQQFEKIRSQLLIKEQLRKGQEENYHMLKDELSAVRDDFSLLQTKLQGTDKKVVDLTRQLAGMTLELYEKDKTLGAKTEQLTSIERELLDSQERLTLVQRIIKEKDTQIQTLEEEVMVMQDTMRSEDGLQEKAVANLAVQAENSIVKITNLEEHFQRLNDKYANLETLMQQKDEEINQLSQTLQTKEKTISQMSRVSLSKDEKLIELNGIVQIYKAKLGEAYVDIDVKSEKLDALERVFDELDHRLENLEEVSVTPFNAVGFLPQEQIFENTKERVDKL